jgi:hypothetical protein
MLVFSSLQPKIFTPGPDRYYLFALGTDQSLYYDVFNTRTGVWNGWKAFGDSFVSSPIISGSSANELNIYGLKEDNYIYQRTYNFNEARWISDWKPIISFENRFVYPPTLILPSGTLNRLDAFGP